MKKEMKAGVYVHIPFCESRCIYCGFYSTTLSSLRERYVDALLTEIDMRKDGLRGILHDAVPVVDTIYIGGGTPSMLPVAGLCRILDKVRGVFGSGQREVTVEVNPDDVSAGFVSGLRSCGVNRISMGVQTFSDERLRFIRRRHTSRQALEAIDVVRNAGIDNVSIDLMFGFPGETLAEWQSDLSTAVALRPSHVSAYSLMYEDGTALSAMLANGKVTAVDDETSRAMYAALVDTLAAESYEHYEISNFARPGFRSIHNSSYWRDVPYLGFGAAAHSYTLSRRSWNVADVRAYISSVENGTLPSEGETIGADTHYNDLVTTALRTCEGLHLSALPDSYRSYAIMSARTAIGAGLLEHVGDSLRLTRKGLFVSDMVMSDLIKVD